MYKKIYVEITNICNLKCPFCLGNKRKEKFVSLMEFQAILEKLKGHTKYLYFHVLGEPLMHPKINEFIDIASKNYFINLTTNGYLIEKIKHNKNIRQLNISLHSYVNNMGLSLEEYLTKVVESVEVLKKNTYISYRIWISSKYKEKIIAFLQEYYHKKIEKKTKLEENVFIEFDRTFTWPTLDIPTISEKGTCYALKDHIAVLVDGTIVPCCLDGAGVINLGNIFESDIEKIKTNKRYIEMLQGFKDNKKKEKLCQRCDFIK